jgi:hypothetical protein
MPISSQTPVVEHVANGVTTTFAYPFAILATSDLKVKVAGVDVTTGFTVSGVGNRLGGTITFSSAPASGAAVLLYRDVGRNRATDYQENGDLTAAVLDDDLDRLWMALQEDAGQFGRSLRAPVGETLQELPAKADRASKFIGFDASGNLIVASITDGGSLEVVVADGSITLTKLATAVRDLINGALQRSGGTMGGALELAGDASSALHAVPKQQLDTAIAGITGRLIGVQVLTSSTTYTPTAGMRTALVRIAGGGAGGAGISVSGNAGAGGAGGGAGATAMRLFTAAEIGASVAVTIGAAGAGGVGGVSGGNGGTTSFGALMSATGGTGGAIGFGGALSSAAGGAGGSATGGTVNNPGGGGGAGFGGYVSGAFLMGAGGTGGSNEFGGGGRGGGVATSNFGGDGGGFGCGGGGAGGGNVVANGGSGRAGVVIIYEYA